MKVIDLMRNLSTDILEENQLTELLKTEDFKNLNEFKGHEIGIVKNDEISYTHTIVVAQNDEEWDFAKSIRLHSIRLVNKGKPELEFIAFRVTPESINK